MTFLRALILVLLVSCGSEPRTLHVGVAAFRTEIVDTPESREHGLMGRTDLTDETAMLFVFPADGESRERCDVLNLRMACRIGWR